MRIPPRRSQSIEMAHFLWIDRARCRAAAAELVLHESRSGAQEEIEVPNGCLSERESRHLGLFGGWWCWLIDVDVICGAD